MSQSRDLLIDLATHLESAARVARALADSIGSGPDGDAPEPSLGEIHLEVAEWIAAARELHPAMGDRQAQVLGEVAKAHPAGTGTGPIWRAIEYEQTNTYLALDALARQGLIRKDDTVRPHQYHLGDELIRYVVKLHHD